MEQKNKITLRQFYRNIDEFILNQAHDEAILYSKFLLKQYPKNIELYKLLGKTFLDKQAFDLALLLFEKILEIDPDDFVSHIGLSLISENFGNLERALVCMQRAYEIQPSNESLQKEVIRLIRAKDGFAPEKLRLSRGALIKMYTRSQLADQAIAEARLGIHESPDRTDFKIHLAEMLFKDEKPEQAIEFCMKVLKDFPYCRPILEMLFRELPRTGESNDSDVFKSRLIELDPYFAYMKPETNSVNDIPDVAIMVEAGHVPASAIEDLEAFITENWDGDVLDQPKSPRSLEEDWQSIVDDAVANNGIGEPMNGASVEDTDLNDEEAPNGHTQEKSTNKREVFLNKLTGAAANKDDQPSEEIPDWILSYENLEKRSGMEVIDEDDVKESTTLELKVQDDDFEEDGMTDHEAPINPKISDHMAADPADWKKPGEVAIAPSEKESSPALDDTQKIKILKNNPDSILQQLETALSEDDKDFALECIDDLIAKEYQLESIASQVESYLAGNPSEIDLWLVLVKIFRKMGKTEEALSALESAQINITI